MNEHMYWVSGISYAVVLGIMLLNDIIGNKKVGPREKSFRQMATWVIFFCLQDALWGLCEAKVIDNNTIFFISSSVFHMSTVITTFFWLKYVLIYLGEKIKNSKIFLFLDGIVIAFELVLVIVNIFETTLFDIVDGQYVTGFLRPLTFINQYIVYLIIGISTLFFSLKKETKNNAHYRSVFLFTLAPILLGIFQLMFPDAPFYSLGYFMGCFIVHVFVVASDREIASNKEAQLQKTLEMNVVLQTKQKEIDEQYEILKSISKVFDYINLLNFSTSKAYRFDLKNSYVEDFDIANEPHTMLNKKTFASIDAEDKDRFWEFTNLSTLQTRMTGKKTISSEFKYTEGEWIRVMYIRIGDDVNEPLNRVAYAIRNITKDRKREEQVYLAMENLLYSLHVFDVENNTMESLIESDILKQIIGNDEDAQLILNRIMKETCKEEYLDMMLSFVDLSTVSSRMNGKKYISNEFVGKYHGWVRMSFIPIEVCESKIRKMVVTTQIIDSEKNEMMNLVYKSSTDELTSLLNRRRYEEKLDELDEANDLEDCIIVAMDVNGLKKVNDTLGHKAGDELLIGASDCMKKSFSSVGDVFRTGGDEFMAILKCDEEKLQSVLTVFDQAIEDWTGVLLDSLSISYGYVSAEDYPLLTVRDLTSEADKRMYEAKAAYYRKKGIERRRR